MFCAKCGNQLAPEDQFCKSCGTAIQAANPMPSQGMAQANDSVVSPPIASAPSPAAAQQYYGPPIQSEGSQKSSKKPWIIIGVVLGGLILLIILLVTIFSSTSEKLVCTSPEGNITIMYNDRTLIGYTTRGIEFDLDEQQGVAARIGISQYLSDFSAWFRDNTSGSCQGDNSSGTTQNDNGGGSSSDDYNTDDTGSSNTNTGAGQTLQDNEYTRQLPKPFPFSIRDHISHGDDGLGVYFVTASESELRDYVQKLKNFGYVESGSTSEASAGYFSWIGRKGSWK